MLSILWDFACHEKETLLALSAECPCKIKSNHTNIYQPCQCQISCNLAWLIWESMRQTCKQCLTMFGNVEMFKLYVKYPFIISVNASRAFYLSISREGSCLLRVTKNMACMSALAAGRAPGEEMPSTSSATPDTSQHRSKNMKHLSSEIVPRTILADSSILLQNQQIIL